MGAEFVYGYLVGIACAAIVVAGALEYGRREKPPEQDHAESVLLAADLEDTIDRLRVEFGLTPSEAIDVVSKMRWVRKGEPVYRLLAPPAVEEN